MKVTWILGDGSEKSVDVEEGVTLMEAAVANDIPHIIGECGGCMSCATCHVFVDEAWREKAGKAEEFEEAMLDMTEVERQDRSRLSCQITMSSELDGIRLIVPILE